MSKNDAKSNIIALAKKLDRLEMMHFEVEKALHGYGSPNKKIFDLVQSNVLVRLQRGLYRLQPTLLDVLASSEILAQLLHGPSYISMEWALAHYGLIPERVDVVTSVTVGRKKNITTPSGTFEYQHLTSAKYSFGFIEQKRRRNSYLLATPLKATIDLIYFRLNKTEKLLDSDVQELLIDNYRIDLDSLYKKISRKELLSAKRIYRRVSNVSLILDFFHQYGGLK